MDQTDWPTSGDGPPDPLPEIATEGLRAARVQLWADLYQKVEFYERTIDDLVGIHLAMVNLLPDVPSRRRSYLRRRLARIQERLDLCRPSQQPVEAR